MRNWIIGMALLVAGQLAAQQSLTLTDIFASNTFSPAYIWGLNHLPDGRTYSKLEFLPSRAMAVVAYDYATGEAADTLLHSTAIGEAIGKPALFFSYTFSSDLQQALIPLEEEQIYRYSSKADHYLYNRTTGKAEQLYGKAKQLYPTFAPDGSHIAFVADNNLYVKDLQTGVVTAVTEDGEWNKVINGAADWVYEEELELTRAFEWSPDGRFLTFLRFDESRVRQFDMTMYDQELYPYNYSFKYPKAGEDNAIVTVHTYEVATGILKDHGLSTGDDHYFPRLQYTQDPGVFCVQRLNRQQNVLDLLLIDAETGDQRTLMTEENPYYIDITNNLTFLANGKEFLWTSEQDGYNHIYLFGMDGKPVRQVTKGAWDVTSCYGVDESAGYVYYQSAATSPLERHVYRVKLTGRGQQLLTPGDGTHEAEFSADFSHALHTWSAADRPYRFAMMAGDGKEMRVLEENKRLSAATESYGFVEKEFFTIPVDNAGVSLNAWMLQPMNREAGREYPVLMFVYGGPGSQTVQDSWGGRNDPWFQYLVQQGYIVVSVDNRGTGARGQEFKKCTYKQLGVLEVEDQIAAARYLAAMPQVDGDRIGIFGWSYGGYMSSGCLFRASEVFRMAIAVAPVTHWKFYDTIYTERFMQKPQDNADGYDAGSPISYVDGLEGKFLLIHGTADDNVHVQNTMELVRALVEASKQFDQFIYPDKNHGIPGRATRLHLYNLMSSYIMDNL